MEIMISPPLDCLGNQGLKSGHLRARKDGVHDYATDNSDITCFFATSKLPLEMVEAIAGVDRAASGGHFKDLFPHTVFAIPHPLYHTRQLQDIDPGAGACSVCSLDDLPDICFGRQSESHVVVLLAASEWQVEFWRGFDKGRVRVEEISEHLFIGYLWQGRRGPRWSFLTSPAKKSLHSSNEVGSGAALSRDE